MASEIVKVQRPWSASEQPVPGRCLVYAKGHKNVREQAVPAEVWNELRDQTNRKGYWHASYDAMSGWDFGDKAPWQDW